MKKYIKPETEIVHIDLSNGIALEFSNGVGDDGQGSKSNGGWEFEEEDGNNSMW